MSQQIVSSAEDKSQLAIFMFAVYIPRHCFFIRPWNWLCSSYRYSSKPFMHLIQNNNNVPIVIPQVGYRRVVCTQNLLLPLTQKKHFFSFSLVLSGEHLASSSIYYQRQHWPISRGGSKLRTPYIAKLHCLYMVKILFLCIYLKLNCFWLLCVFTSSCLEPP